MQDMISSMATTFGHQAPRIVGAILIFLIGWIVAGVVRGLVSTLLSKTSIDNKISGSLGGENIGVENMLATVAYYVVMLMAGVAALDALGLTAVSTPLNALSGQIMGYVPKLLGAALLLVVAWVLATICKKLVTTGLEKTNLDSKIGGEVSEGSVPLSKTLGDVAYWLVFLVFLPGLLSVLEIEGLLEPINGMMNNFLEFIPNLFGAAIIFGVGWLVAKIVQNIVVGILSASGVDQGAEKMGIASTLGKSSVSKSIGTVVFALILLPTVVGALDALKMRAVTEPIKGLLESFVALIPALFGAFVVLALAHVIAKWLQPLITSVLGSIGTDRIPELLGLGQNEKKIVLSDLAAKFFYIAVMVMAALEASRMLGLESLTAIVSETGAAAVQVLVGCVIFGIGLYLARLASDTIKASGMNQATLVASLARAGILFLVGAMALRRMGLADEIIETAFSLLLGAVAVAIALAFGLGGRDAAGKRVEGWFQSIESKK